MWRINGTVVGLCLVGALVFGVLALALQPETFASWWAYSVGGKFFFAGLLCAVPAYWVGNVFYCSGSLWVVLWRRIALAMILAGALIVVSTMAVRIVLVARARETNASMQLLVLPRQNETRWLNALVDEQDSVLFYEQFLFIFMFMTERQHNEFVPAMRTASASLRETQPMYASPFVSTYLSMQSADAFDAVVVEPSQPAQFGVVFLHGFLGNIAVQCWEIAQAVRARGGVTVCPSTDSGSISPGPQAQQITRATLDYLHARGITQIYLGGFSNGGFGTSRLVPELARDETIRGLFIFSPGVENGKELAQTGLPILLIDCFKQVRWQSPAGFDRTSTFDMRDLPGADYVGIASDDLVIIEQPAVVENALGAWLDARLRAQKTN